MGSLRNPDFWSPVVLSLQVTAAASVIVFAIAVAAAWWMTRRRFCGRMILETLFMLPLVLPPTVVGFVLLLAIGRRSWLGRAAEWLFGQPIVFTWTAAVMASAVVAFPIVYQTVKTGFQSIDRDLEQSARSAGATEGQVLLYVTLPLAWRSLVSAYILGFARSLGEFGATLMVAGNIPGRTQTIPTAIYIAVESGKTALAWGWVLSITIISFLLLALVSRRSG